MAAASPNWLRFVLRLFVALVGIFLCYRLGAEAARAGVARLFNTAAIAQSSIEPADEAVRLAPADPETHYTRALTLVNLNRLDEAVSELRQAVRLRPHHYYQWLDLGVTLDRLGDQSGAIEALRESVRLAPGFAQPRWQLGNLLFRERRYEEAFAELRNSVSSNPNLFQVLMGLAWVASSQDVTRFENYVRPTTRADHLLAASFLAKEGKGSESARHIAAVGEPADQWERDILNEAMVRLLTTEQYSDAFAAWLAAHNTQAGNSTEGQLLNANFTDPIVPGDVGFAWQVRAGAEVSISIDPAGPLPNSRSLRMQFLGKDTPGKQLLEQLVLLQPNTRYSLRFSSRANNLISGGPPVITVTARKGETIRMLGQSSPLSPGTRDWSSYRVDFSTEPDSRAVKIAVQRMSCAENPCPIFGDLWLGAFSLAKLTPERR